jgi:tetratricopeptide (TPR) repeat protein
MTTNKQLTDILLSVPILFVLSTVFVIRHNLGDGIVSGKYFWFYVSMTLFAVIAIPVAVARRTKMRFVLSDVLLLLFCLFAVGITYIKTGRFPTKSLLLVFLSGFWFCLRIFLTGRRKPMLFLLSVFFMITGLAEAVWGLWQLYGIADSQHRIFSLTGSFFNPGPYAGWLAMVFPVAVGCVAQCLTQKHARNGIFGFHKINRESIRKLFSFLKAQLPFWLKITVGILTVTSILLVLPASMSRSSWLAALGGTVFIGIAYCADNKNIKDYFRKHVRLTMLLSVAVCIIIAIAMTGLFMLKADSATGRVFIWKTTIRTITQHPAGVGLGNFGGVYGEAQSAYFASGVSSEREQYVAGAVEYAFNEYLQICMETGIIGFLIFMTFVAHTVFVGVRRRHYIFTGAFIALLIFAAMSYPFNILPFAIAFVFLAALIHFTDTDAKQAEYTKHVKWRSYKYVLCIVASITFFTFCFLSIPRIYKTYEAYRAWPKIQLLGQLKMYKEATAEYEKQYPYLCDNINFLYEYEQCLSKTSKYEESNQIIETAMQISCNPALLNDMGRNYQALKQYDLAEKYLFKSSDMAPNLLYPFYWLAKLYYETGHLYKAREMVNLVLTKKVKINSKAVEELREDVKKYDLDINSVKKNK